MKVFLKSYLIALVVLMFSCKTKYYDKSIVVASSTIKSNDKIETVKDDKTIVSDTSFVNLKEYSSDFVYDMKYATDDNFLKSKVYDCAECFMRFKTAKALIKANSKFMKLGYKIKLTIAIDLWTYKKKCGK